jgi:hypothetical protein
MKKAIVMFAVIALIVTISVGAYAHYRAYDHRGWKIYGPQGSYQSGRYGHRGGMHNSGMIRGRFNQFPRYCDGYGPGQSRWSQGNAPAQQGTVAQMITEEKAKEIAEAHVKQYFPGYTINTIEKDSWRPLYFVTIQGENTAELQVVIHGFGGQVIHVFPKTAE